MEAVVLGIAVAPDLIHRQSDKRVIVRNDLVPAPDGLPHAPLKSRDWPIPRETGKLGAAYELRQRRACSSTG